MRRSLPWLLSAGLLLSVGCSTEETDDAASGSSPAADPATAKLSAQYAGWDRFGAEVQPRAEIVQLEELIADPDAYEGKTVLVSATVGEVCKKKGCWMTMGDDGAMRVTFQDYGFFVPLDCEGREVLMEGKFSVATLSEADAKHYLEDEGRHEEAAAHVGEKKELSLVATGVLMRPAEGS